MKEATGLLHHAVKIRFVKNLDIVGYEAVCLWWADEIHVDEKLRGSPCLMEILKHEMKHYRIMQRVIREKTWWKRELLLWYNAFWDWYDNTRMQIVRFLDKLKGRISASVKNVKRRELLLIALIVFLLLGVSFLLYVLDQTAVQNKLLWQKIEGLKEEKKWIWDNAVTMRIEYGDPRLEGDRIIIPVVGLNQHNETLFIANASLPFETENCSIYLSNGRLFVYADTQILSQIESLRADLKFYKRQYNYYYQKYLESQPKGLQLLISNRTAFLALWNTSFSLRVSNVRYKIPMIPLEIEYYSTYGCCVIEARNFIFINHASFPVLPLEMVNGTYARFEWKILSKNETAYVIQETVKLVNVTFTDGTTYQHVDLTLNHVIHKSEGDPVD